MPPHSSASGFASAFVFPVLLYFCQPPSFGFYDSSLGLVGFSLGIGGLPPLLFFIAFSLAIRSSSFLKRRTRVS